LAVNGIVADYNVRALLSPNGGRALYSYEGTYQMQKF